MFDRYFVKHMTLIKTQVKNWKQIMFCTLCRVIEIYLTISRRRRGDYKLTFTEPRSGEMNI